MVNLNLLHQLDLLSGFSGSTGGGATVGTPGAIKSYCRDGLTVERINEKCFTTTVKRIVIYRFVKMKQWRSFDYILYLLIYLLFSLCIQRLT